MGFAQRFVAREDEARSRNPLTRWHREWSDSSYCSVHDDIAALPFRFIVTSGLDPLMESALRRAAEDASGGTVPLHHGRNEEPLRTDG